MIISPCNYHGNKGKWDTCVAEHVLYTMQGIYKYTYLLGNIVIGLKATAQMHHWQTVYVVVANHIHEPQLPS